MPEVSMEFREWDDPFRRPSAGAKWKQPHLPKTTDSECIVANVTREACTDILFP